MSRKQELYDLVAYLDGVGGNSEQIGAALGYSPQGIRKVRQDLGLARLRFRCAAELVQSAAIEWRQRIAEFRKLRNATDHSDEVLQPE